MRTAFLATVMAASLAVTAPAAAQGIPVYDQASYLQMLEQVKQGIQQVRQLEKQVGEARRLYDSLNALSNVNSIGEALNNPLVRRVVPQDAAQVARVFDGDVSDLGDLERRVDVLREVGRKYTPPPAATDAERYYAEALERSGRRAARDMALGERVYANADQRLAGLEELQRALSTAPNARAVMDLQARISAEAAMIQNEQVRLQGLAMMQQADQRLQEQREREERAQRHANAQAVWKGMYDR